VFHLEICLCSLLNPTTFGNGWIRNGCINFDQILDLLGGVHRTKPFNPLNATDVYIHQKYATLAASEIAFSDHGRIYTSKKCDVSDHGRIYTSSYSLFLYKLGRCIVLSVVVQMSTFSSSMPKYCQACAQ
jgi:hypothetical protein